MWNKKQHKNTVRWSIVQDIDYYFKPFDNTEEFCRLYNEKELLSDNSTSRYEPYNNSLYREYYIKTDEFKILESGIYNHVYNSYDNESYLDRIELKENSDSLFKLEAVDLIIQDFNKFINSKNIYTKLKGLVYRRGVMLYGPPGTGKSSAIHTILKNNLPKDTIVIFTHDVIERSMLEELNKDSRFKIIIFEEFTNCLSGKQDDLSASMLDFLDGETALHNCFIIGVTNYPERLPPNAKRKGRFDKFYKVGYLTKEDITIYLEFYDLKPTDLILSYNKMTIANLKELILLHYRDNLILDDALQIIVDEDKAIERDFIESKRLGFINND